MFGVAYTVYPLTLIDSLVCDVNNLVLLRTLKCCTQPCVYSTLPDLDWQPYL